MNDLKFSTMTIKLLPLLPVLAIFSAFVSADDDVNLDDISMYIVSERISDAKTIFLPAREAIADYTINNDDLTQLEIDAVKAENKALRLEIKNLAGQSDIDISSVSQTHDEMLATRNEQQSAIAETRTEGRESRSEAREKVREQIREQREQKAGISQATQLSD